MRKEILIELDRLADLLGVDRATIVRNIIFQGIEHQKLELGINLYLKGETLERSANISGAYLWDLIEEIKKRGITSKIDLEQEKDTYIKIIAKNNKELAEKIRNIQ
ncbi:MAG: hypothetical protein EU532_08725 [Promethearchaeota archaeon]|nr:MAG: hypothetical protein EU532_08725 [Candidatus Lokiarchaeota archaeon]